MANQLIKELNKKALEARAGGFLKIKDGETITLVKVAEGETSVGQFGTQAVYAVSKEDGTKAKFALKIGHPILDKVDDCKVGGKFKVKRTGSTQKDTRYEITLL
jgi:hypothetical protein